MKTYRTTQVAKSIGIHPNTVRLYEELGLIPKPERKNNGYRIFTEFHMEQLKLARTALQIEILQNGLRKLMIEVVKTTANSDFDKALSLTNEYLERIQQELNNAEEAIDIVKQLLSGWKLTNQVAMKRKEVSEYLQLTMDTLRNWEMNGLLTVKRKENGYRVYTQEDINRLKIIRSLRCANYSLESILRMLNALSNNPATNIREVLDTPSLEDDIVSVCDKLITSLNAAESNANQMKRQIESMKHKFS
jgi:DNA-binding transcriptional MerR regulator